MRGDDRTISIDEILNTVDGVDSKGVDMMIVFTTNELEAIQPAMLRPGRLDVVIPIPAPDAEAAERLVRQYGGAMINKDETFERSREALAGKMPAVIREAVDRSKLYAITENDGDDESLRITDDVLWDAVYEMEDHIRLLTPKVPDERSETVKAADILASAVEKTGALVPFPIRQAHHEGNPVLVPHAHRSDDVKGKRPASQSKLTMGEPPIAHD
jgi:transitional endoplasmic reticulum ATPase